MHPERLRLILKELADGKINPAEAETRLKHLSFEDIGFAKVDHHRQLRKGYPEVIFAPGKSGRQIKEIAKSIGQAGNDVLITRLDKKVSAALLRAYSKAQYFDIAGLMFIPGGNRKQPEVNKNAVVAVCSAGTSDIPVAEEAALTAWAAGCRVERVFDIGVAGLHRISAAKDALKAAKVIIVAAGMEGALASVIGGLVDKPVVAVPTSVGYGASFNGIAALLGMLNSCAPGVVVVNIDNGFGAGMAAAMIARNSK